MYFERKRNCSKSGKGERPGGFSFQFLKVQRIL
jgi:hypothetical protein